MKERESPASPPLPSPPAAPTAAPLRSRKSSRVKVPASSSPQQDDLTDEEQTRSKPSPGSCQSTSSRSSPSARSQQRMLALPFSPTSSSSSLSDSSYSSCNSASPTPSTSSTTSSASSKGSSSSRKWVRKEKIGQGYVLIFLTTSVLNPLHDSNKFGGFVTMPLSPTERRAPCIAAKKWARAARSPPRSF